MSHTAPNPHDAEEALKPVRGMLFEAQEQLEAWQPAAFPSKEAADLAWDLRTDAVIVAQDAVITQTLEMLGVQR